MNNFYNKKEKHADNDFEMEGDDFLNSSMKDMDDRTKSTKKKKINQDYDEGIQFVDLASLDREAIFKHSIRSPENSEYMSTVLRGFIFIFMLLISLFAVFLIFKTPYYSYYNQEEPIIIGENKSIMVSDPFAIAPEYSKNQAELEAEIIEPEQSNVKLPTAVISKPKPKVSDEDEMLRREFENSRSAKNKKDTELTKLLKESETATVVEKPSKKPLALQNKSIDNKIALNDMPEDLPAEESVKSPSVEFSKPNKKSGSFKYPAMDDKKMVADNSKVLSSGTEEAELNKSSKPKNSAPELEKSIDNSKTNNVAQQNVWLVNIYSTAKKDDISNRLLLLKNQYRSALAGTTFYLVESTTEKGTNYRISLSENQSGIAYPSFANNTEAKSFCAKLKDKGLDCFVSSVYKSALPKHIIK